MVKTTNGFSAAAVYRGDYLNKTENGYRGANIDILKEGGHFAITTGSNGMAAVALGGTGIVPSNALVDRNLTDQHGKWGITHHNHFGRGMGKRCCQKDQY